MNRKSASRDMIDAAQHLCQLGFLVADCGLVSVRAGDEVLFTPPGAHRGRLDPKALDTIRLDGRGKQEIAPDTEVWTHLVIYRERQETGAVILAQPPTATGYAVSGGGLDDRVLPELVLRLGAVPFIRRESPGKGELDSVVKHLERAKALLIAHRGVLTIGTDLWEAVARQELVEHYARVLLTARLLGKVESLPDDQVARLVQVHFEQEGGRNL